MKACLGQAATAQKLNLPILTEQAAKGLHTLVNGMVQNWLLDTTAYNLRQSSEAVIDVYPEGRLKDCRAARSKDIHRTGCNWRQPSQLG